MTKNAHPADIHDVIRVRGARQNNLRSVDVDIPKRRLTVFTGVSGSGKSSLVFGTVAAESQRLINETYSAFVQGFMPALPRPDVDYLDGVTAAIIVDQERMGANSRSTVGTATDVLPMLRVLFSRLAQPSLGSSKAYSFNVASAEGSGVYKSAGKREHRAFSVVGGMCPRCQGIGTINDIDLSALYDDSKSLADGAIQVPGYTADGWYVRTYSQSGFLDPQKPIRDYSPAELHDFLYKEPTKVKVSDMGLTYEGLVPRIQKSFLSKDPDAMQPHVRTFVDRAVTYQKCPECHGTRVGEAVRNSKIGEVSIADACAMQVDELAEWIRTIDAPEAAPLLENLQQILDSFVEVGLGYLSLERSAGSLSGGEAGRTKLVSHLGSALTDVTYVFDEPSAGLHPHDVQRVNGLLRRLRDKGNTVLVVEHKPEVIEIADHIVDLGPGAGKNGGNVCYEGSVAGLRSSGTVTGRHLDDRTGLKATVRQATGSIEIRGAQANNLCDVDVDIPLGVLTVITGVAGSGKSSLVESELAGREQVVMIDQAPIRGSRRSSPITYTGLLDPIRKAFAKHNGVKPALFSANSEGACPACHGMGVLYTDLAMMAGVVTPCDECGGKRFGPEVLEYRFGGVDISEVFGMSAREAATFLSEGDARLPAAASIAHRMVDVGLGYVKLGQPLTTLSGGERQRLKLATHLGEKAGVYILDEPTSGLHLADVERLLALFDRIVDSGKTVVVIEHHQAVMAHADWLIDLGPGAGSNGGRIVFEGTPADLAAGRSTVTGEFLSHYVSRR